MARTATSRLRTQVVTEENGCAYQDYHGWWMREDDGLWHYRSVHGSSDNGIASPFGNAPVEIRIIKNFWHWVELPKATAPAHPTSGEGGGGGVNEDPYSEYRIEAEHRAMTPTPPTERAERDWPGPQNYIGVCAKCDEQYSGSGRDVIGLTCYACYLAFASQAPTPPEPVAGAVTHDQARESLQRLCNSHFRQEPCARVSIPARPEWDDDLILDRYIKQQAARARCLEVACRTIRPMSGHDAFDLEAAIRTAFAQDAEGQEGGAG